MASPWEPTQADLERKLGGAHVLQSMADPASLGYADPDIVESYLSNGRARVRGAVSVKHEPEALDALSTDDASWLRRIAVIVAAYTVWSDSGRGDSMPSQLGSEFSQAETDLDRIAQGLRRVGRASGGADVPINQPVGIVDHDPNKTGLSVAAFRSSGFR